MPSSRRWRVRKEDIKNVVGTGIMAGGVVLFLWGISSTFAGSYAVRTPTGDYVSNIRKMFEIGVMIFVGAFLLIVGFIYKQR